jgi:hypothetical protein
MQGRIFITPAAGLVVRDPDTREPLAAEGEWKLRSQYWLRRKECGDVVEAKPPKADKKEVVDAVV